MRPTAEDADAVKSREDLVAYLVRLHTAVAEDVENPTAERYLEAMAAWVKSSPAFFRNTGRNVSDEPEWSFFAHALSAALIYE